MFSGKARLFCLFLAIIDVRGSNEATLTTRSQEGSTGTASVPLEQTTSDPAINHQLSTIESAHRSPSGSNDDGGIINKSKASGLERLLQKDFGGDDIEISGDQLLNSKTLTQCNMDTTHCLFDANLDLPWGISYGSDPARQHSSHYRPSIDVTFHNNTGKYLMADMSSLPADSFAGVKTSYIAMGRPGLFCLEFWHWVYATDHSEVLLSVFLQYKNIPGYRVQWKRQGDTGGIWLRERLSINTSGDSAFRFSFAVITTAPTNETLVALDNVQLSDGHCDLKTIPQTTPVPSQWSGWHPWGVCSVSCGLGVRNRNRTCDGTSCPGPSIQTRVCYTSCPPPSFWGAWGQWGSCENTCGSGYRFRSRDCNGNGCPGHSKEARLCKISDCSETVPQTTPVPSQWSGWHPWGVCSVSCGLGVRNRNRTCDGTSCPGSSIQTRICYNYCLPPSFWGAWSHWGSCDVTCGSGHRFRSRGCNGHGCPGHAKEARSCIISDCSVTESGECQGAPVTVSGTSGAIYSSGFLQGKHYPDNVDCSWLITVPHSKVVKIRFITFRTEAGRDILTVYDGPSSSSPQIDTYSGGIHNKIVYSSSHNVFLNFKSNHAISERGFIIEYSATVPVIKSEACQGTPLLVTDEHGIIESMGYQQGQTYPQNTSCAWNISVTPGKKVLLKFLFFHTEPGYDIVRVYDGGSSTNSRELGQYSGTKHGIELLSSSHRLFITFNTDSGDTFHRGFKMQYDATVNGTAKNTEECPSDTVELTDPAGYIYSVGFQFKRHYPNNARCTWRVTAKPGQIVRLVFEEFRTEEEFDVLRLYDGPGQLSPTLGSYSGISRGTLIDSTQHTLFLEFLTDLATATEGFKIKYQAISPPTVPAPKPDPRSGGPRGGCGVRPPSGGSLENILGGTIAAQNSWPWQVPLILRLRNTIRQTCGGAIVSKRFIVTAAHCVQKPTYRVNPRNIYINAGAHHVFKGQHYNISHVIVHPGHTSKTQSHDIALLKTTQDITFSSSVSPICLPDSEPAVGAMCYGTGWGYTSYPGGSTSPYLKEVRLKVRSRQVCIHGYHHGVNATRNHLCVGENTKTDGLYKGDSGGPLNCEKNGRFYLAGVASYVHPTKDAPDSFTNVFPHKDWIENHIKGG